MPNLNSEIVSDALKKVSQQKIPLQKLYEDLANIDQMDLAQSADCREKAQQILANPKISLNWRDAIAERLHEANHTLAIKTVTGDDSY
ncbi:MAG: hypothetical protein AAF703_12510 [Cyanobacteria bacterium P01_D01_bin.105]